MARAQAVGRQTRMIESDSGFMWSRLSWSNLKPFILPPRPMFKWLIAIFITVFIAGIVLPRLAAFLRIGRLPGDLRVRWRGREYSFPFATTVVLSLLAGLIVNFL